jgi:excisionase family DNA binding protein
MDITKEQPFLLNRKSVSKLLSISVRTVDTLFKGGHLKPVRIGNRVLVPRQQVDDLAQTGTTVLPRQLATA